jgi:ubiquinone/menaquinone biosynthesis C-methylase UbiE
MHEMPPTIREATVREMARVTKPTGRIVIVDYRLPDNPVGRAIGYHAVKLYERDRYAEFMRSDLNGLLRTAGIQVQEERAALLGMIRIVVGR